jgi:CheY-like chemotaxis protein
MLASGGFELHCAANGDEALGLLATLQPALMLLDLAMPGMGGLDLMRRLRDSPRTAAIPIIIMTGNAGTEIVHGSLELGAVDFLVKPFDRATLLAKLRRALGSEKAAEQS